MYTDIQTFTLQEMYALSAGGGMRPAAIGDILVYIDFPGVSRPLDRPISCNTSAITLCTNGFMRMRIDGSEQVLRKGGIMIYGPYHVMEILEYSDDYRINSICFSESFPTGSTLNPDILFPIYRFIQNSHNEDFVLLEDREYRIIDTYFNLINEVLEMENMMVIDYLMTAMMSTVRDIYQQRLTGPERKQSRHEEYFEKFMQVVLENYRQERSVQFYAEKLRITPKYLSTVIKEYSGRSAMDWINDYVIQEAKQLLTYSKQSIQEITYHLNFSTQSFFGKYFKRYTGISPSEFRAHNRKSLTGGSIEERP